MTEIRPVDVAAKKFHGALIGSSVLLFGGLMLWIGITGDADPPYLNVAFTGSWIVFCLGAVGVVEYARRRRDDAPVTWGQAMVGAFFVFFLMFWVYGVVPHWWLAFADNELNWRQDRQFIGPILPSWWAEGQGLLSWSLPFELNYRVVRDIVAVLIYGLALVAQVAIGNIWQNRGRPAERAPVPASTYGRPLVKEGESN